MELGEVPIEEVLLEKLLYSVLWYDFLNVYLTAFLLLFILLCEGSVYKYNPLEEETLLLYFN